VQLEKFTNKLESIFIKEFNAKKKYSFAIKMEFLPFFLLLKE